MCAQLTHPHLLPATDVDRTRTFTLGPSGFLCMMTS